MSQQLKDLFYTHHTCKGLSNPLWEPLIWGGCCEKRSRWGQAGYQGCMAEAYYNNFCFGTPKHNSSHHNYLFQKLYFKNRAETSVYPAQTSVPEDVYLWALRLLEGVVFLFFFKWQHSFQMKRCRVSVSAPEGFGRFWHNNSPVWVYCSLVMTVLNLFYADLEPCSVCALYAACLDWPIITENK